MNAAPVTAVDRFLDCAGQRIHLRDHAGGAPALVFVHGGSAHERWWDFVAPGFAPRHRILTVDLRGHGDSEWSRDEAYALADYAGDLATLVDRLELERPVLVGHSLGSFVSLRLALDRPDGFRGVVSVDGRATFGESGSRYLRVLRMLKPMIYPTLDDAVRRFTLLPPETSARREVLEHVGAQSFMLRSERDGGGWIAKFDRASLSGHHPFDFRAGLASLACPVLFVRGEHSKVLSSRTAAELAGLCRDGRWVEIAGAHHHVLLDRPEALAAVIEDFLADVGLTG